jgi:asparagine synthase (glutamine-hydrolysing)
MPGIVGIISKRPRQWAETQLHRMVAALKHKESYVDGTWIDESLGVYVGWVERKGTFPGTMPLLNEERNMALVFSGEEYPDPQSLDGLKTKGHAFPNDGRSYLVHLAEEDGTFPKCLNGRFHGLLADRAARTVALFNDRYGMHRLYYHESPDAFYFSAEAKAILCVRPDLRTIDAQGMGELVACGCVLEDRTLFRGLHVLPTGSAWIFRNGTIERRCQYFNASEWEEQAPLAAEDYYLQLREVFSKNLPRYFDGRQPIAVSLTGGLDTRMIMAWAQAAPGSLPGYTFGGPFRECEDVRIARKVAKVCQQPYQVIPVDNGFLSQFAGYAERTVYLSDGCAAVNRAADLYVNELAAQIAPVRMTGNYGSEILRRLRAFKPAEPAAGLFQPEFLNNVERAKQTFSAILTGHAVSFTAFRQAPWYQHGLLALEETQLAVRSPFLDNDLVRTAFRAPKSEIVKSDIFEDNDACGRLIADGSPELHKIPTDRGLGGTNGWTMPASRAWLEFTFKAEYAYDYGMPPWLVRIDHALKPLHLERLFLGRHKFCHYRVWYRDALSQYVREMLLDSRSLSRPYVRRDAIESMVCGHLNGSRNHTTEITRLLTLELLHRLFVDSQ